jgi:hypothetical protein
MSIFFRRITETVPSPVLGSTVCPQHIAECCPIFPSTAPQHNASLSFIALPPPAHGSMLLYLVCVPPSFPPQHMVESCPYPCSYPPSPSTWLGVATILVCAPPPSPKHIAGCCPYPCFFPTPPRTWLSVAPIFRAPLPQAHGWVLPISLLVPPRPTAHG